jgi:hypothetical protein
MPIKSASIFATITMIASLTAFAPALGANETNAEIIVDPPREVERWFAALGRVNRRDFDKLIAEGAKIILKDLGIEQTKQEFIAALGEWNRATKNASIVYRYESIDDGNASALVCYRFKSNEQLNLESFTFDGEQITGSVQEAKGEDCRDM